MSATPNSTERIQTLYSRQARIYDLTRAGILFGRQRLVRALDLQPGEKILDVGCGTGALLPNLAAGVGSTGTVHGIDCTHEMIERARRRCRERANSTIGSSTEAPVTLLETTLFNADRPHAALSGTFDAIVFSYALTLMPDWREHLEWANGRLTPTGRIGVVDFASARTPARQLFEAHAINFDAPIYNWLRRHTNERTDETRRAWLGTWRYFVWVGNSKRGK